MVSVCEKCGHPLPSLEVQLDLTKPQRRIFNALQRAGQAGLTRDQIIEKVYTDDPNGGPLTALNSICVQRWKMNKKMKPFGLFIKTTKGKPSYWSLSKHRGI